MRSAILAAAALYLAGLAFADFTIPPDQPICRLYGMIQVFASIGAVISISYAGFVLLSSHDLIERNNAKMLLGGTLVGLMIVWLAPLVVKSLVGASDVCGW
jgi:type IV secretory pathway VirB2 component (pilin)